MLLIWVSLRHTTLKSILTINKGFTQTYNIKVNTAINKGFILIDCQTYNIPAINIIRLHVNTAINGGFTQTYNSKVNTAIYNYSDIHFTAIKRVSSHDNIKVNTAINRVSLTHFNTAI